MLNAHIRSMRAAESKILKTIGDEIQRQSNFSLIELVNSRMSRPARLANSKALDATLSVERACREAYGQPANGAWLPLEVLTRDLSASGAPALFTNKVRTNLEDALRPASALIGAGATVISGIAAGNLLLPAVDNPLDPSGNWTSSEGSTYVQSEPSFRQISIAPHTLGVELRVSRRLLKNATPDLEDALRREILTAVMREIDRVGLIGTAASNQPDGLLTLAGIPVVAGGTNGAAPTWQHLCDLEHAVASANGRVNNGAYLTNAAVTRKLRTTQRATGLDYILGNDKRILGYETRISELVPANLTKGTASGVCSAILFGDFSELLIGLWGPAAIDLIVDDYSLATQGLVKLVARVDVGIAPRHEAAFAVMKDVLTA
jgi:HK97 family phage major capsid protein